MHHAFYLTIYVVGILTAYIVLTVYVVTQLRGPHASGITSTAQYSTGSTWLCSLDHTQLAQSEQQYSQHWHNRQSTLLCQTVNTSIQDS